MYWNLLKIGSMNLPSPHDELKAYIFFAQGQGSASSGQFSNMIIREVPALSWIWIDFGIRQCNFFIKNCFLASGERQILPRQNETETLIITSQHRIWRLTKKLGLQIYFNFERIVNGWSCFTKKKVSLRQVNFTYSQTLRKGFASITYFWDNEVVLPI